MDNFACEMISDEGGATGGHRARQSDQANAHKLSATTQSRGQTMFNHEAQERERLLLHVGCGRKDKSRTTPGFQSRNWKEMRLDIDPSVQPDVVASMTDMTAVADQSVDAIFSSHNLEHLYPHEAPIASSARFSDRHLVGHRAAMSKGNLHMAHRSGYSDASLRNLLMSKGFATVATLAIPSRFELWALATKSEVAHTEMESLVQQHFPLRRPPRRAS